MWKKWFTSSGDSWVEEDDLVDHNTTSSTGMFQQILQQQQQQQQLQNQYKWVQAQGVYPGTGVNVSSTSTVWGLKPTYPYAIDEDFILIDWARKRGERFAEEMVYRMQLWADMRNMQALMKSGPYPSAQMQSWLTKYYYANNTTGQTSPPANQITYGGVPVTWDSNSTYYITNPTK